MFFLTEVSIRRDKLQRSCQVKKRVDELSPAIEAFPIDNANQLHSFAPNLYASFVCSFPLVV